PDVALLDVSKLKVPAQRIGLRGRVEIERPIERIAEQNRLDVSALGKERSEAVHAVADVAPGEYRRMRLRQLAEQQPKILEAPRVGDAGQHRLETRPDRMIERIRDEDEGRRAGKDEGRLQWRIIR